MYLPMLLILLAALGLMTSDIHLSAQPNLQIYFDVGENQIQSLMSLFFAGTVLSSWTVGCISDAYGRKSCIMIALILLILANLALSFSNSFLYFEIARFLQGISAGALSVLCYAVIQDCSKNASFSRKYFSYVGMILIFVPTLSPTIGGFILTYLGWRSIFNFLLLLSLGGFILSFFLLKETNINRTGIISIKSVASSAISLLSLPRFYNSVFIYPLASIGYWIFITDCVFVFKNFSQFNTSDYKYLISMVVIMFAFGNIIARYINNRIVPKKMVQIGILISLIGALLLASEYHVFLYYLIGNMVFMFGLGLLFSPATFLTLSSANDTNKGMGATLRSGANMLSSLLGASIVQCFSQGMINLFVVFGLLLALSFSLKLTKYLAFERQAN